MDVDVEQLGMEYGAAMKFLIRSLRNRHENFGGTIKRIKFISGSGYVHVHRASYYQIDVDSLDDLINIVDDRGEIIVSRLDNTDKDLLITIY